MCLRSEQIDRLTYAYGHATSVLLSGDRDGDGFTDGFELFYETDSRNPLDHFDFEFYRADTGFSVQSDSPATEQEGLHLYTDLVLLAGTSTRVRGRLIHERPNMHPFAPGFRVRVTRPGADPILVPVVSDGWVTFDLELPEATVTDWKTEQTIIGDNPVTGETIFEITFRSAQSQAPLPVSIENSTPSPPDDNPEHRHYQLRWPLVSPPATNVLIEAAPVGPSSVWSPVWIFPRTVTSCTMVQMPMGAIQEHGPVKFRAVPIR